MALLGLVGNTLSVLVLHSPGVDMKVVLLIILMILIILIILMILLDTISN